MQGGFGGIISAGVDEQQFSAGVALIDEFVKFREVDEVIGSGDLVGSGDIGDAGVGGAEIESGRAFLVVTCPLDEVELHAVAGQGDQHDVVFIEVGGIEDGFKLIADVVGRGCEVFLSGDAGSGGGHGCDIVAAVPEYFGEFGGVIFRVDQVWQGLIDTILLYTNDERILSPGEGGGAAGEHTDECQQQDFECGHGAPCLERAWR